MTNACVKYGLSPIPDAPIRLQDVPRKTLRMYGIILEGDDSSSDDENGVLIIDETIGKNRTAKAPAPENPKSVINCYLCPFYVADRDAHMAEHCKQPGCPMWIPDPLERAIHTKNHNNHPTKPFFCQWCKKRYRFYPHLSKHLKLCKSLRRRAEAAKSSNKV